MTVPILDAGTLLLVEGKDATEELGLTLTVGVAAGGGIGVVGVATNDDSAEVLEVLWTAGAEVAVGPAKTEDSVKVLVEVWTAGAEVAVGPSKTPVPVKDTEALSAVEVKVVVVTEENPDTDCMIVFVFVLVVSEVIVVPEVIAPPGPLQIFPLAQQP